MSRILILGGTGMLGFTLLRRLSQVEGLEVHATLRGRLPRADFHPPHNAVLHPEVDATEPGRIETVIRAVRPREVINCVGLVKQLESTRQPTAFVRLNALLPHEAAAACTTVGARLIHISTDCVFDGTRGNYAEAARCDADDLYGRSKCLGEVAYDRHLTIRTSLIGHELRRGVALVDWFLSQHGTVKGYRNAIFSGLPTVEIAAVLAERILPSEALRGLFHLASEPISKLDLLRGIAAVYGHRVEVTPVDRPVVDRSLNGALLGRMLGYRAPAWPQMIAAMHADYLQAYAPLRSPEVAVP